MIDSMDMNLSKLWKIVKDKEDWYAAVHGIAKSQSPRSNWTMLIYCPPKSQVEYFLSVDFLGFLAYLTLLVHASTASLVADYFHSSLVSSTLLPLNPLPGCSPGLMISVVLGCKYCFLIFWPSCLKFYFLFFNWERRIHFLSITSVFEYVLILCSC